MGKFSGQLLSKKWELSDENKKLIFEKSEQEEFVAYMITILSWLKFFLHYTMYDSRRKPN